MNELEWVKIARQYIGTTEIVGSKHNPVVVQMWREAFIATNQESRLKEAVWQNDETAWCGGFMGFVFAKAGLAHHIPKSFPMARAWVNAGTRLEKAAYGCVVVFWRGSKKSGSGHIGICVGKDKLGNLMILGGNQGNQVNIKPFGKDRVLAYRWLGKHALPNNARYNLPVLGSDGKLSTNEA